MVRRGGLTIKQSGLLESGFASTKSSFIARPPSQKRPERNTESKLGKPAQKRANGAQNQETTNTKPRTSQKPSEMARSMPKGGKMEHSAKYRPRWPGAKPSRHKTRPEGETCNTKPKTLLNRLQTGQERGFSQNPSQNPKQKALCPPKQELTASFFKASS